MDGEIADGEDNDDGYQHLGRLAPGCQLVLRESATPGTSGVASSVQHGAMAWGDEEH